MPIIVVLGNPPYSGHSANKGEWIGNLLRGHLPEGERTTSYYEVDGQPLGERNPKWLQDDYVKFIRWGQWRIEQSGGGTLAFISNHGYLDNPTFRGMRQSLMESFDEIYVLDLHGNKKKKEVAPDGSPDQNVFDIQQGVAIGIFIKYSTQIHSSERGRVQKGVYHSDLWGSRDKKYKQLWRDDLAVTEWERLDPQKPYYLFVPRDIELLDEYQRGWSISEIYQRYSMGITTGRDAFVTSFSADDLEVRINDLKSQLSDDDIRMRYNLNESTSFSLTKARTWAQYQDAMKSISPIAYRSFDNRYVIYAKEILARPREEICTHLLRIPNLSLITCRRIRKLPWQHTFIADTIVTKEYISSLDNCFFFPMFLSETVTKETLFSTKPWPPDNEGRIPNMNTMFVQGMEEKLGIKFDPSPILIVNEEGVREVFSTLDIFNYIYAILHSPTYRERYKEFLKIDFPRVPLTSDTDVFWQLVSLGRKLVSLHLLETPVVNEFITRYPVAGDNRVERGYPKYDESRKRIYINKEQYFEIVPSDIWEFQVGGYQICDKWLKDRRGRHLSYDDLTHYQNIIVALNETISLMGAIDRSLPKWPME